MKIVHLCLCSFFPDGFAYQENMLPKFHKQQGHDVEVIASLVTFDEHGKPTLMDKPSAYINEHGIPVTRLDYKAPKKLFSVLRRYEGFESALNKAAPDVIFVHGCQFLDIDIVACYAESHNDVRIFVDNHADFLNSATNPLSKYVLHGIIWKHCAKQIEPFTEKFYGVLPCRVDFLKDVYGLPAAKCELLVMGADDETVNEITENNTRKKIRDKFEIKDDEFLIVSGGKINGYRPETLYLLEAVNKLENANVKLLIFGRVADEFKEKFNELCNSERVIFVGWLDAKTTYSYISAADLVVYPGLHSVMWEQTVALGIPCIFRKLVGVDHVDIGGNAVFAEDASVDELTRLLNEIADFNGEKYNNMQLAAQGEARKKFLYSSIAAESIL